MQMLAIATIKNGETLQYIESVPVPFREEASFEEALSLLFPEGSSSVEFFEKPRWTKNFLMKNGFDQIVGCNNPAIILTKEDGSILSQKNPSSAFETLKTSKT